MTSILKLSSVESTHKLRPPRMKIDIHSTNNYMDECSFEPKRQYIIKAEASVSFWTNNAMYEESKKNAMTVLNQSFYTGALSCIAQMRWALLNDDMGALKDMIDELEAVGIGGRSPNQSALRERMQ